MSFTIKVNEADLANKIRLLARHTSASLFDAMKGQVKLITKDIVKLTPPRGASPLSEDWKSQKSIGEKAVKDDLTKHGLRNIFIPKENAKKQRGKSNYTFLWKSVKGEKYFGMNDRFKPTASMEVMVDWHKANRNSRGKVRLMPKPTNMTDKKHGNGSLLLGMVVNGKKIDRFIKKKQKNVGIAKSGWRKACAALGISLPAYVTRHRGQGRYSESPKENPNPWIEVGNMVYYIQSPHYKDRIISYAVERRLPMLQKQIENTIRANDRKGIFR